MSPMMQPQNYQESANMLGNIPQNQLGQDEMVIDQQQNFYAFHGQMQTPVHQGARQSPTTTQEAPQERAPKKETLRKQELDLKKKSMAPLTTIGSNSKKRDNEDFIDSDRSEKKANHGQEKKKESDSVSVSANVKLDGGSNPQANGDSKRKITVHAKESTSTPFGGKYISDGKRGYKSMECSPDSTSQVKDNSSYRDKKHDLVDSLIKQNNLFPNEDVLFKVCFLYTYFRLLQHVLYYFLAN